MIKNILFKLEVVIVTTVVLSGYVGLIGSLRDLVQQL